MGKYDIADAHKLKVFMQEISEIISKYDERNMYMLKDVPEDIKKAIEWISDMVEKKV